VGDLVRRYSAMRKRDHRRKFGFCNNVLLVLIFLTSTAHGIISGWGVLIGGEGRGG